jgi:hypothetical protein
MEHPQVQNAWCVDATDTELLKTPFPFPPPHTQGTLYIGWENQVTGCDWMIQGHQASSDWLAANPRLPLLNPGILGGDRQTILQFCDRIITAFTQCAGLAKYDIRGDMAFTQRAVYGDPELYLHKHPMNHVSGPAITTLFKGEEHNAHSIWRHK